MGRKSRNKKSRHAASMAQIEPSRDHSHDWYVPEGMRAQQLMQEGRVAEATAIFKSILGRMDDAPSYGKAVIVGRLARCLYTSGRPDLAVAEFGAAIDVTENLSRTDGVRALMGTLHAEKADALAAMGQHDEARTAYETALQIAESTHDRRGQGVDLGQLGALALSQGKLDEALLRYRAALRIFQEINEPPMEAIAWHQLGVICHQARRVEEAGQHYRQAARINEEQANLAGAIQSFIQLALLNEEAGDSHAAEEWYRKAINLDRQIGDRVRLGHHLNSLADLLQKQPNRLVEARQLVAEALAIANVLEPTSADIWRSYGILADITAREAALADGERRIELQTWADTYRQLRQQAPRIAATLARLGDAASCGTAVMLGRLGRCFHLARRPDLAVEQFRRAIAVTEQLGNADGMQGLRGALQSELGEVLVAAGHYDGARTVLESALEIAEALQDLRGQATVSRHLGALALAQGDLERTHTDYDRALRLFRQLHDTTMAATVSHHVAAISPDRGRSSQVDEPSSEATRMSGASDQVRFEITLHEDETTDYVFDTDLFIDGRRETKIISWPADAASLADDARPVLLPWARVSLDHTAAIRLCLPAGEPIFERHSDCTVMRRTRRDVVVSGGSIVLWDLIRRMDGGNTVAAIVSELPADSRASGRRMLAALVGTGAIDVSGRPIRRFLHSATKKGVLPGGGLESEEVLRLATDANHRAYPAAPTIAIRDSVPEQLRGFHVLTRSRRSRRDYQGRPVSRENFSALLHTACGVTGTLSWSGREVKLRAYPASGALYAVEIYPVAFRVEDLEPAVYHYRPIENLLEIVKPAIDRARFVGAMLPIEREMVAGAAAMICLTGFFPRHERKYGEGGYRMLVAEAGHISQNLILAATALGLSARPFGGVFDDLVNEDLGLNVAEEQFLLAVLVGHTA